jgi:hypothetical protein
MKFLLIASLAWLAAPSDPFASDPFASAVPVDGLKRERLPADVDFVVHLDLEGLKRTEIWKHLAASSGELDLDLDELGDFQEEFGLDPLTDVRAVTLFKVASEEDPTVVLFSSTDKVDQALAKLQKDKRYRRVTDSGIELHTFEADEDDDDEDDAEAMFAYVHAVGQERVVVLASQRASALRAARVLRGQEPSHQSAGTLLTLAPERGSFLYVAAAQIPHLDEFTPASHVIGLAQGIQVDLGEAGGFLRGHMGVSTKSPEDALNISNVVNGLVSLARLAGSEAGEALELLTGLRLSTRGSELSLDFEYEVARLLELLQALDDESGDEDEHEDDPDAHEDR